ncbi:N-acyl-aromatic-L-amino acid amidohydrolase (carboxylate-forming) B-like isoform X2 [Syngnathoides biaculeatus]|uniref:N-acyl-aromatic-L-amino acid amidohydrolase (carboxylate-forming) B-like isoform X2 n=1 Tax=Syngnathoides biaculeatus TaxID=300417 RepID=UPI002ADE678F|nr:N-acyl-aromatic-L-amino acid amidohydrolase (carboxylate-forming) B-like isoform X2 [Syngnathoides biaculeatus]XP_061684765.1 N-acyl-aromatic-L-amino acid amidohydrolase (carboxylate-forming) B-like isoform X2 [Syngnathoides biaculeatus]
MDPLDHELQNPNEIISHSAPADLSRQINGCMEHVSFPPLSRFAVCGGTHGNEMTGVYVVREMKKKNVDKVGRVSVMTVLSNPEAVHLCRRYVETDLNRCFTDALLSAPLTASSPHEMKRAHELNALLGPKGSQQAVNLLCDIHNTTANMGVCFIFYHFDWLALHIYRYVQSKISFGPVRAIQFHTPLPEAYSLESVSQNGFALEVGPQPTGVVRADIYNMTTETLDLIMEWIEKFNSGTVFEGGDVEAFSQTRALDYPRDPTTDEITAAIHPQLQDNDFKLLRAGDPIFQSFTGEAVKYEGEEAYPFFVNECAYYEKKVAFQLAQKITIRLPSISVKN